MNEEELLQSQGFESIEQRTQWEQELREAEEEEERLKLQVAANEEQAAMAASMPPVQEQQPVQEQPPTQAEPGRAQAVETSPFKNEDGTIDYDKIDQYGAESDMDVVAGIQDFVSGTLSLIPGIDIKPRPKFENEVAQSVREISSVVLPTMLLGGAGSAGLTAQAGKVNTVKGLKHLNDPFVKWLGNTAFQAGAGAFVDYAVPMNQTDDNLAGTLKKTYPRSLGWIPDNVATLDGESPEVKRGKNVLEGAYLGIGIDMIMGLSKLMKRVDDTHDLVRHTPENEKAKEWFDKNIEIDKTPEDVIERSAAKRSTELDEVGSFNFDKSVDPNEPIFGYHDAYGYPETGIRSVDDLGIVGASIDAARIDGNLGTVYGRVGSVMSEGALKFANETSENARLVIKGLASTLQDAGQYGYKIDDKRYLSFKEIENVGQKYADDFYEMDLQELQKTIYPGSIYQGKNVSTGTPELTDEGYQGVMGAIKKYMDDFVNMDEAKATAYVGTSMAGQISDMAQGMRLTEGSGSIQRAQEQILDRVEFLMAQKGMTSYVRGRSLNMLNIWNRMTTQGSRAYDNATKKRLENLVKGEKNKTLATMERIKQETAETIDGLRAIKDSNPEMLSPLMMAYELTDGNVKTISSLNNYVKQSTSIWSKAFFDGQPEIPSVINQAFYANVYNGALSSASTPIKAVFSGSHLLVEKPLRHFAGALITGDLRTARRALYQYSSMWETLTGGLSYAKQIFKRSALDPNVTAVRDDMGLKNQGQLDILTAFADAKAAKGDYGPQMLMENITAMNDLANHPVLRMGTRSMQAMDGFMDSLIANFEAKGRAFDNYTQNGKVKFNRAEADKVAKDAHAEMFDENGIITDKAVKKASGEMAFNLDNAANDDASALIRRMPVLKPFMLFTKTPLNELKYTASYNPLSPVLGTFMKDVNVFKHKFDDIETEKVMEILTQRGVDVSDPLQVKGKYNELRADMLGRKALGTLMTGSAVALFMDDRLHGAGHYNRQVQKTRDKADWKRNSIRGFDDKWYSYEGLGPITTYLSLVATIGDNFDVLEPNDLGNLLGKTAFAFGASFKDRTHMAGLEPFFDVLRGDVGAINRWGSGFLTSAAVRGSSQMAEIARLLDPELKLINNELDAMIMNRLPGLKGMLPKEYDWIEGGEVNVPDSIWARLRNTYTPWKESGKITPEKQFLIDVEFDATATLRTNGQGEKLSAAEQSEILSIMGKDGLWKEGIKRVMNQTSKGGKGFRQRFKEGQSKGLPMDTATAESLHNELDAELRRAIGDAITGSKSFTTIRRRQYVQERTSEYLKRGQQQEALEYLEYTKKQYGI
jgi:hypothetical protein